MYLVFGSCGYIAQKTPYLTAPACPLSTQPVGLGVLGPEIMCRVHSGTFKISVLCDRARTGFATVQHARLILIMIPVLSMAYYLNTVWFRTAVLSNQTKKVHLSPAPCLCQRQVGVGSGGYNTSSQKCFHILQQLSQVCIFSLKGSVLWYPHRSAPGSSTIPVLCFSELPLLTSSGSTCRDHVFLVQLCLVH